MRPEVDPLVVVSHVTRDFVDPREVAHIPAAKEFAKCLQIDRMQGHLIVAGTDHNAEVRPVRIEDPADFLDHRALAELQNRRPLLAARAEGTAMIRIVAGGILSRA